MKRKARKQQAHIRDARMGLLDMIGLDHPDLRDATIETTPNYTVAEMVRDHAPVRHKAGHPLTYPGILPEPL